MIQTDRTQAPAAHEIASIPMINPVSHLLPNNLPVYELSAGPQEVVKVELVFNAGSAHHSNPLVPAFSIGMLQEGTQRKNAAEIASGIDDFGAFLETSHDKDFSNVTLFTLNRYLPQTLPLIREIITEPVFPEKEWEIMRSNRLEKFIINMGKVSYIAGKRFQELLFAPTPYGAFIDEQSYKSVTRDELVEFWKSHYRLANSTIFLSGHVAGEVRDCVRDVFGKTVPLNPEFEQQLPPLQPKTQVEREQFILKEDAVQSAIRIGRRLFTKTHPDYFGMKILSTILGGYFGSRLMSNIREDKGYTYGIGAGIASLRNDGYFVISTEVGTDVCSKAIAEIYKEIEILQNQPVPEAELHLVKNYLLSNLLKSFDGPMEQMDRFKSAHLFGLDLSFYNSYTDAIKSINSETIRNLARTWLQKDDLIELVVGKK